MVFDWSFADIDKSVTIWHISKRGAKKFSRVLNMSVLNVISAGWWGVKYIVALEVGSHLIPRLIWS